MTTSNKQTVLGDFLLAGLRLSGILRAKVFVQGGEEGGRPGVQLELMTYY